MTIKSKRQIAHLKRQWLADPSWDIEDTQGFEDYAVELARFRVEQEKKWAEERQTSLLAKSASLGCYGNTILAAYIERLENRLAEMEDRLVYLERKERDR
jgi:hypothetical protein